MILGLHFDFFKQIMRKSVHDMARKKQIKDDVEVELLVAIFCDF